MMAAASGLNRGLLEGVDGAGDRLGLVDGAGERLGLVDGAGERLGLVDGAGEGWDW